LNCSPVSRSCRTVPVDVVVMLWGSGFCFVVFRMLTRALGRWAHAPYSFCSGLMDLMESPALVQSRFRCGPPRARLALGRLPLDRLVNFLALSRQPRLCACLAFALLSLSLTSRGHWRSWGIERGPPRAPGKAPRYRRPRPRSRRRRQRCRRRHERWQPRPPQAPPALPFRDKQQQQ